MKIRVRDLIGILVFLNVLAWVAVFETSRPQLLEVVFFDVGQGDAVFIETPERYQILIDGGPDSAILEKLGKEMPFWDRTIDLIVLTHPEHDHIAGLIEVLKRYKVENILWTGVVRDTDEYNEWQRLIKEEGAEIIIAKAGLAVSYFTILYPLENLEGESPENTNNTSIVLRLAFGQDSFLFTGDIYSSDEKEIIRRWDNIASDVLKVGHHGSKTSTSEEFLEKVKPEIAVIQCGKDNKYGHPRPETLANLEKSGIKILRTDLNGDIKIVSNGNHLQIQNSND